MLITFKGKIVIDENRSFEDKKTGEVKEKRVVSVYTGKKELTEIYVPKDYKAVVNVEQTFVDVDMNMWSMGGKSGVTFRILEAKK